MRLKNPKTEEKLQPKMPELQFLKALTFPILFFKSYKIE